MRGRPWKCCCRLHQPREPRKTGLRSRMPLEMPPLRKFRRPALTLFLLTVFSGTACAEESASGTYLMDVAFTLTAVTDYRYRGLSLSNKKPALQAELSVGHHSGLYTRLWGSSIADNGGAAIGPVFWPIGTGSDRLICSRSAEYRERRQPLRWSRRKRAVARRAGHHICQFWSGRWCIRRSKT